MGHSCHSVRLAAKTSASEEYFDRNPLYSTGLDRGPKDDPPDLSSLLETEERVAAKAAAKARVRSSAGLGVRIDAEGPANLKDLDCECEPYACSCHKQCFCRLSGDPFKGTHYPPDANCPVCAKCPGSGSDDGDGDGGESSTPEQDFKCSCSFEGIGGAGISNGGYMECDCKVADCSCSKKCACRLKKDGGSSASFRESLPAALVREGTGARMASQEGAVADEHVVHSQQAEGISAAETPPKKNIRRTTPLRANNIVQTS